MLYQKPSTFSVSIDFSQASSQYQFILTQGGCPNLINQPDGDFTDGAFLTCGDAQGLNGAHSTPNQTYVVTCTNISGSYNMTFLFGGAHFSSGLTCSGGDSTIAIPLDISPDLPGDCIIDTISSGSSGDICG